MRRDLVLEDTTLRDGEQAPGIAFAKEIKLAIHDRLVEAGVGWIEAGIPAMGGDELAFLRELAARGSDAMLIAWSRGVRADIDQAIDVGLPGVHIGLPTSGIHLEKSVARDRSWLLATAQELVGHAKDRGAFVSVSAEDVGRTERCFLQEYACAVHDAGADRLRLSDTVGILHPQGYADRVAAVVAASPIDVQCHAHNDFGLAVANTLAGLQAGARYFHVTVNAMGERAGMPDLAQTVMVLQRLYDRDLGVDTTRLTDLSRFVAERTGHALAPWQPVVGENVFAHESGIHVNAMLRDQETFEPIDPVTVGGRRRYVVGKHSGRALLRSLLQERGVEVDDAALHTCLGGVRALAVHRGGAVGEEELVDLYQLAEGGARAPAAAPAAP